MVVPAPSIPPPQHSLGSARKRYSEAIPYGSASVTTPRVGSARSTTPRRMSSADPLMQHGYQTLGPIAAGAFSQIARARNTASRREVAVKTFNKAKVAKEPHLGTAMKNELDVLMRLQTAHHPSVANIIAVLDSKSCVHAVLEYCGGGSLQRQLQTRGHNSGLREYEAMAAAAQLCSALAHMHGMGIAHRDVKPENILFVDSTLARVKLCDFGFAIACRDRRLRTVCGSPQYMAPELSQRERSPYYGPPVDVWALCAVVYEMLHGKAAFRGSSMEQLGIRIMRVSHESFGPEASAAARGFIKKGLVFDTLKRATATELMSHAWVSALSTSSQGADARS